MKKIHAPLFPLAVSMMMGIVASRWVCDWTWGLAALLAAVAATLLTGRWPRWRWAGIVVCMLLLGVTLGARQQPTAKEQWGVAAYHEHATEGRVAHLRQRCMGWREDLLEHCRQWGLSADSYGIIAAMALGDKSHLDRELRDTYSRVGVAHVLALSGLHLMIIYSFITLLFGWGRLRLLSQVVTVCALWAFALLVGLSPSVTRSAVMITVYALLSLGHRKRMSVNTLALTAIIMLAVNPASLFSVSFQLSFMAVLAILLLHPLLNEVIPLHVQQRHRWLRKWWGMTTVSVAAQVGTAPLVAYYFGCFAPWFLVSNYIAIPLATVVLYLTLAALLTAWWPWLTGGVVAALAGVVGLMNRLLALVATLPFCSIEGIGPSLPQVVLIYIIIGIGWYLMWTARPRFRQSV